MHGHHAFIRAPFDEHRLPDMQGEHDRGIRWPGGPPCLGSCPAQLVANLNRRPVELETPPRRYLGR
jgi:hypothetical protein